MCFLTSVQMDWYERQQDRLRNMLEIPSSELGDPESDFSDIEEEDLIINAEDDSDSEMFRPENPPVEMDVDEEIANNVEPVPEPRNEAIDLSLNQQDDLDLRPNVPQNERMLINPTYIGRNKPIATVWSNTPQPRPGRIRSHNIVTQLPGPKRQARQARSELECWNLFLPETILEKLVHYTNIKIRQVQPNYARVRDARQTDISEMKALLGLLYLAGVSISAKQNVLDLWKKDGLGVEIFSLIMGVNRFRFLLQNLRFDDVDSEDRQQRKDVDRLYCFREFFEDFSRRCKENYSHSAYVTIDEMLPNFRGKCSFRVYMPKKPGKFGIKVWAVTDSKTFYTSSLEVYISKQHRGPFWVSTSTRDVVNRIVSHIEGTGRNITCDNFFTSLPLAEDLLQKKLTLVGTIRKNKSAIPYELITDDKENRRPTKSSMFAFTLNETLVSYKATEKKFVLLLSTLHEDDEIDEASGDDFKPSIITFYNKNKCGVDVSDAMQKEYSVSRISNRWPLTLFFFELNVGAINAFVIWKANNIQDNENYRPSRKGFLEKLGRGLIYEQAQRRVAENYPISRLMKDRLTQIFKFQRARQDPQAAPVQRGPYRICGICPRRKNRKTTVICNNCNVPICKEHTRPSCTNCAEREQEPAENYDDED